MSVSLKKKIKAILAEIGDIETDASGLQDQIDDLDARVTALENPNLEPPSETVK